MGDSGGYQVPDDAVIREIAPSDFTDRWEADSFGEALEKAERANPYGPDEQARCPTCLSVQQRKKRRKSRMEHRIETEWKCLSCHSHHDTLLPPLAERPVERAYAWLLDQQRRRDPDKTMPVNTPFEWTSRTDLKDPSDRLPVVAELPKRDVEALAIHLRRPWSDDDGLAYSEIAEWLPYSRQWVGERIRAWRDGDLRDLVADPTAGETEPTEESIDPSVAVARIGGDYDEVVAERTPDDDASADPFEYDDPVATDGGSPASRWDAYGT